MSATPLHRYRAPALAFVLCLPILAGCTTIGGDASPAPSSGSGSFMNIFKYGGTTVPASRVEDEDEEIECPSVEVLNGMAAMRQEAGGSVRSQLSLGQTARECRKVNGRVVVKIGAEVRALLGPGGSPGTFGVPLRFVVKRGEKVASSKLVRSSITIPRNDTQATIAIVEDNMSTEGEGEIQILVGFDPTGRGDAQPPRSRRR